MDQQAAASTTSRKEQVASSYRKRYSTDPEFREKERQTAAYINSRRDHYKKLWQARYAARKAAAAAAAVGSCGGYQGLTSVSRSRPGP
jgi:hypothetical protein